jgi:hypothetical protein
MSTGTTAGPLSDEERDQIDGFIYDYSYRGTAPVDREVGQLLARLLAALNAAVAERGSLRRELAAAREERDALIQSRITHHCFGGKTEYLVQYVSRGEEAYHVFHSESEAIAAVRKAAGLAAREGVKYG